MRRDICDNFSREYLLICENYTNSGKFILESTMTDVLAHNEGKLVIVPQLFI